MGMAIRRYPQPPPAPLSVIVLQLGAVAPSQSMPPATVGF
jgi:hypothetical protein